MVFTAADIAPEYSMAPVATSTMLVTMTVAPAAEGTTERTDAAILFATTAAAMVASMGRLIPESTTAADTVGAALAIGDEDNDAAGTAVAVGTVPPPYNDPPINTASRSAVKPAMGWGSVSLENTAPRAGTPVALTMPRKRSNSAWYLMEYVNVSVMLYGVGAKALVRLMRVKSKFPNSAEALSSARAAPTVLDPKKNCSAAPEVTYKSGVTPSLTESVAEETVGGAGLLEERASAAVMASAGA